MPNQDKFAVIWNGSSGRNARDATAIEVAKTVFGPQTMLYHIGADRTVQACIQSALNDGATRIIAAGGDGTIMSVASALAGTDVPMGVLPLGTFNYFSRGLGISQDIRQAAETIKAGQIKRISVGSVNGQVFLNNASVGVYPAILKERETVYRRWGRWRVAAHWSVVRTFIRFRRPTTVSIMTEDGETTLRTPLLFVARSSYQLRAFGLEGSDAISQDGFAVFVSRHSRRIDLFRMASKLMLGTMRDGVDFDLLRVRSLTVTTRRKRKRELVAFDGEKRRMPLPLRFEMMPDALSVIVPASSP